MNQETPQQNNSENKWTLESLGSGEYMSKKDQERYFTWDFMKFFILAVILVGIAAYFWDYVG